MAKDYGNGHGGRFSCQHNFHYDELLFACGIVYKEGMGQLQKMTFQQTKANITPIGIRRLKKKRVKV